jgi:hypothetical protein
MSAVTLWVPGVAALGYGGSRSWHVASEDSTRSATCCPRLATAAFRSAMLCLLVDTMLEIGYEGKF